MSQRQSPIDSGCERRTQVKDENFKIVLVSAAILTQHYVKMYVQTFMLPLTFTGVLYSNIFLPVAHTRTKITANFMTLADRKLFWKTALGFMFNEQVALAAF
jgi:hypothetical protein